MSRIGHRHGAGFGRGRATVRRAALMAGLAAAVLAAGLPANATCLYTNPDKPLTLPNIAGGEAAPAPQAPPVAATAQPPATPAVQPAPAPVQGPGFAYYAPGDLNPHDKGRGRVGDRKIYLPDIIFPVRLAPGMQTTPPGSHAFMNSQIWGYGGGGWNGKGAAGGSECDARNYDPLIDRDDYCEVRGWPMPMCPSGQGHQGQDIRPPHCDDNKWDVLAVVDGVITLKTSNTTVVLKGGDGTEYYYLHMHPDSIKVSVGQTVKQGALMGRISNFMNGARDTTHHLHFQVKQSIRVNGQTQRVYVPVFASLISAYRKAKGLDGAVDSDGNLMVDPAHEIGPSGVLTPEAAPPVAVVTPPFVSWPIPNVVATDGRALPPLSLAQYFKARSPTQKVVYTATGLPAGLSVNGATGAVKGVVAQGASKKGVNGAYTVLVSADDGAGNIAKQSFIVTSQVAPIEIGSATHGKFYKDNGWVLIDAGAAFLNPSGLAVSYSAEGLPAGLSINPVTGRISGRLSKTASQGGSYGIYTVTVTALQTGNQSLTERVVGAIEGAAANPNGVRDRFTITAEPAKAGAQSGPDVPLPVVAVSLPSVRAFDGQAITTINAALGFKPGGDGTGRLTYAAASLPIALSIDPDTGLISGAMADNASKGGTAGAYTVTVIADNGSGGTASQSFVITSRNAAPVLATPTVNKSYNEGEPVEISVGSAFTSPDPDTVTYTISGLPSALVYDRKSGLITGAFADGASKGGTAGVYTITATANDGKGGQTPETFTLTARARPLPPVAAGQASPVTVMEGAALGPIEFAPLFKPAPADTAPLMYAAKGLPSGLGIDPATGVVSGTIAYGAAMSAVNGTYAASVTATDQKTGLIATQPVMITVLPQPVPPVPPVQPTPPTPAPAADQTPPSPAPPATPDVKPQPVLRPPTVVAAYVPMAAIEGVPIAPLDAAVAFARADGGGTLAYAATGLPGGLTIDPASGIVSGTIAPGTAAASGGGPYAATVSATDAATGLTASQTLTIMVAAAPTPPAPAPVPAPEPPAPPAISPAPVPAPEPAVVPPAPAPTPAPSAQPTGKPAPAPSPAKSWTGWAWDYVSGAASTVSSTVKHWWSGTK